jgi:hypothetical protein
LTCPFPLQRHLPTKTVGDALFKTGNFVGYSLTKPHEIYSKIAKHFPKQKTMPAKRRTTRHDFSLLSTDQASPKDEGKEDSKQEGNVTHVMRAVDAPTSSKFYTDAQTYISDFERRNILND